MILFIAWCKLCHSAVICVTVMIVYSVQLKSKESTSESWRTEQPQLVYKDGNTCPCSFTYYYYNHFTALCPLLFYVGYVIIWEPCTTYSVACITPMHIFWYRYPSTCSNPNTTLTLARQRPITLLGF